MTEQPPGGEQPLPPPPPPGPPPQGASEHPPPGAPGYPPPPGFPQQYPGSPQPYPGSPQQYAGFPQPYPGSPQQYPGFPQQNPGFPQPYPGYPPYPGWMPYAQPQRGRFGWLKWVGIGCGGLAALGVVAIVIAAIVLYTHRPLKDFPEYPGAKQTSDNLSSTNGKTHETRIWSAPASRSTTEAWYASHLNGDWILDSPEPTGDVWDFHTSGGSGDIHFRSTGTNTTEVEVDFSSS